MYERNQSKFRTNYNLPEWCLVERNKLIRSVGRRDFGSRSGNYFSCFVQVLFFVQAADSLLTNKCIIMHKKQVKSNIVYDSFNDVTWDFSGFFEKLADYHNGNVQEMSEQLISAIETLMYMQDDAILDPMVKNSALNLFTVREILIGIETMPAGRQVNS